MPTGVRPGFRHHDVCTKHAPLAQPLVQGAFTFDWDKLKQEAEAFSQRVAATFEVRSETVLTACINWPSMHGREC